MGGTKKPTITKLKKMLARAEDKSKKEEAKKEKYHVVVSEKDIAELISLAKKSSYITPSMISKKLNIKISAVKVALRDLAAQGKIRLVAKNGELEIYAPS